MDLSILDETVEAMNLSLALSASGFLSRCTCRHHQPSRAPISLPENTFHALEVRKSRSN